MKKIMNNLSVRQLAIRFSAWAHRIIEKKAAHLEDCFWYPGPCQIEFPY